MGRGLANVTKRDADLTLGELGEHFVQGDIDREITNGLDADAFPEFRREIGEDGLQRNGNAGCGAGTHGVQVRAWMRGDRGERSDRGGLCGGQSDFNRRRYQGQIFSGAGAVFATIVYFKGFIAPPE